jgi:lipid A disaccharide synthetase
MFAADELVDALTQLLPMVALLYVLYETKTLVASWLNFLIDKNQTQQQQIANLTQEKLAAAENELLDAKKELAASKKQVKTLRMLRAKSPARQAQAPSQ